MIGVTMVGVIYLARGVDANWQERFVRFARSYQQHPAGIEHKLYIIYKNFASQEDLNWAYKLFDPLKPKHLMEHVYKNSYAGGSFLEAAREVREPAICALASSSEIMHDNWLSRMMDGYLSRPGIGIVCCSGSYGYIREFFPDLTYPNPHIRNLSFLMSRKLYIQIATPMPFTSKVDDLAFEHGPNSLTRQLQALGKTILVVEKDRIRDIPEWGDTTYRGNGHNVLVHDKGTRDHMDL